LGTVSAFLETFSGVWLNGRITELCFLRGRDPEGYGTDASAIIQSLTNGKQPSRQRLLQRGYTLWMGMGFGWKAVTQNLAKQVQKGAPYLICSGTSKNNLVLACIEHPSTITLVLLVYIMFFLTYGFFFS
jgi:hypothetical protein